MGDMGDSRSPCLCGLPRHGYGHGHVRESLRGPRLRSSSPLLCPGPGIQGISFKSSHIELKLHNSDAVPGRILSGRLND